MNKGEICRCYEGEQAENTVSYLFVYERNECDNRHQKRETLCVD